MTNKTIAVSIRTTPEIVEALKLAAKIDTRSSSALAEVIIHKWLVANNFLAENSSEPKFSIGDKVVYRTGISNIVNPTKTPRRGTVLNVVKNKMQNFVTVKFSYEETCIESLYQKDETSHAVEIKTEDI